MQVIEVRELSHRYGRVAALRGVSLTIPEGAFYALLGPNGAGKTTLLRAVAGLLRPSAGAVRVFGRDVTRLAPEGRSHFTFVGESLRLPRGMTLGALESYLAPLYDRWDRGLADTLRRRFRLDGARRLRTLSRGEQMKAALLCALAPRPRLLVMDEPFTGMDVLVKDELVSGVLDIAAADGCTVLVSSHDLAELELIADSVGFLDDGILRLSESMDSVRERFRRVELQLPEGERLHDAALRPDWLSFERHGSRATFVTSSAEPVELQLANAVPPGTRVESRGASLREIFVALAKQSQQEAVLEEVAS